MFHYTKIVYQIITWKQCLLRRTNRYDIMKKIGFGRRNVTEILNFEKLDYEGKKARAKKLWQEDPERYYEWKEFCMKGKQLSDFFGTLENPIHIDESKL